MNDNAELWKRLHEGRQWGRWPSEAVVQWFCRRWPNAGERRFIKVLDLGCGGGGNTRMLVDEGFTVSAMDISPEAITNARYLLQRWHQDHASFVVGDVTEPLPFGDGEFHAVLDSLTLTHVEDEKHQAALGEIVRVLKPGGRFLQRVFGIGCQAIEGRGFVRYWDPHELVAMAPAWLVPGDSTEERVGGVRINLIEWTRAP